MIIHVYDTDLRECVFEPDHPVSIGQLIDHMGNGTPVCGALVDREYVRLDHIIDHDCTVCFRDVRDSYANMSMQYSLALLYRYAVHQLLPECEIQICNSLSKGLFTRIVGHTPTVDLCRRITEKMNEIIEADMEIHETWMDRNAFIQREETRELFESAQDLKGAYLVSIGSESDHCPIHTLPSTCYLRLFEVRRYRHGILLRFPDRNNPSVVPAFVEQPVLYNAFAEETKWDRITGIANAAQLNRTIGTDCFRETVMISDALHERKIAETASLIREKGKRIILIAGPSSSGKTSFAMRLCIQLRVLGLHPLYLGTDDYFVDRADLARVQKGKIDFEALTAVDTELFSTQMNALLDGENVDIPEYDFVSGKKLFGRRITTVQEGQPIVIEGIHGLNPELTEMIPDEMKLKIYISPLTSLNVDGHHRVPTSDIRILRRMIRDYRTRGTSPSDTIRKWAGVRDGEEKNIFPYCGHADVFFNTQCTYEIAVLKKHALPLLEGIACDDPAYPEAQRIIRFLQYFNAAQDDTMILNNSILREFIGGSILLK
ncbi:MAG: uridine kinase [Bulleidia sp.]